MRAYIIVKERFLLFFLRVLVSLVKNSKNLAPETHTTKVRKEIQSGEEEEPMFKKPWMGW